MIAFFGQLYKMNDIYYLNFKGKTAQLMNQNKQIIRKFTVSSEITNAQVTGSGVNAIVAITMKNGKTILYKSNGQIIRK